jgi:hypothetical protein
VGEQSRWMRSSGAVLLAVGITVLACVLCRRAVGRTEARGPAPPPACRWNSVLGPRFVEGDPVILNVVRAEAARLEAQAARCRDTLVAQGQTQMAARYSALGARFGRFGSREAPSWKPDRMRKYVEQFYKLRAQMCALDAATGLADLKGADSGGGPRRSSLSRRPLITPEGRGRGRPSATALPQGGRCYCRRGAAAGAAH